MQRYNSIAIRAYTIGEDAMLTLAFVENFSGFHRQEKHNASVKSYVGGRVCRAAYPKTKIRKVYIDCIKKGIIFLDFQKKSIPLTKKYYA